VASIETLLEQIDDAELRDRILAEVGHVKKRLPWGLVFERHLPENTRLLTAPIKVGTAVWERRRANPRRLRVIGLSANELVVVPEPPGAKSTAEAEPETIAREDVLVEHDFVQPIFPGLASIDSVRNGHSEKPSHVVIEGENYHAAQLLLVACEGQVDVLYLDPPFNTGNREWSYNNDYVDPNDTYRPSKWLAFMERRLAIAKRLLKPEGVLAVAIDENEHAHLVMLLEQMFPGYDITSVAIVHNPRGIQGDNFSFTNEFAIFVVPGKGLIAERKLTPEEQSGDPLRNWGGDSLRTDARNCFYPIFVRDGAIVGFGEVLPANEHPDQVNEPQPDGTIAVWPIDPAGTERKWRYARQSVEDISDWLTAREIGTGARRRWDIEITKTTGTQRTVWVDPRYDASTYGTKVIRNLADAEFSYPKSIYNTYDVLYVAGAHRRDALIVDLFGGSGTTLHAAAMLNASDGGTRRCVLVTNNELKAETATALNRNGHFRGDLEFEAAGVFEAACRPRVTAAVTGRRPDGTPVAGSYIDGTPMSDGLPENVEFFRLTYLDPAEVEFGLRHADLAPLLWLAAGSVGPVPKLDPTEPLGLPAQSTFAVLFDPSGIPALEAALRARTDVSHVFIVADSADAFAQLAADLPKHVRPVRLYRDYLETLRGATR
jgi:adenine-specific DNA-methyltransferase